MATGSLTAGLAIAPQTETMIEATATPDEIRRLSVQPEHRGVYERVWGLDARTAEGVTFEEYQYWAKIERAIEVEENAEYIARRGPTTMTSIFKNRFSKGVHEEKRIEDEKKAQTQALTEGNPEDWPKDEKESSGSDSENSVSTAPKNPLWDKDAEWRQATRALRTASWGTIFFLVTTDILGWSSTPFVFASVGYGLGVGVFLIFGIAAGCSGFMIYRVFIGLDSSRFPMLSYGDTYFRVYGKYSRHFINILQAFQQFLSVAVVLLGQSIILAQISKESICFIVCFVIITVIGMVSGSIRSLQRIGWLCNMSVWLNIINFVIICAAAGVYKPDYAVTTSSTLIKAIGPIKTFFGVPPSQYQQQSHDSFTAQLNGVDQMIYSYSGAILFVAFMAEMRHPMDFWKGMLIAQVFITFVYIFFGAFVYSYWGQYSASNIGQVISLYSLQTVGNVLGLLTGFFAVLLYFNIGMKTVYLEVFEDILGFPSITTRRGKTLWYILGPIYWILAFVVAAAVPNLNAIVSLIGGLLSLNFTYSFPALCYFGYKIQEGAALPGEGFDPYTGVTTRHDKGMKRYWRGFKKYWYINIPVLMFSLGGFASSGLGTYASIEGAIEVFGPGGTVASSFSCKIPV